MEWGKKTGKEVKRTLNFKPNEFFCPCCKVEKMFDGFIERLQLAREIAKVPFKITSGYRCERYQVNLKDRGYKVAKGTSPHEKGIAADIYISNDQNRFKIIEALKVAGIERMGYASNFVHADMDPDRNPKRYWHYKS